MSYFEDLANECNESTPSDIKQSVKYEVFVGWCITHARLDHDGTLLIGNSSGVTALFQGFEPIKAETLEKLLKNEKEENDSNK